MVEDPETPAEPGSPPRLTFFLDGAHTAESMTACAEWFADCALAPEEGEVQNLLVFNCQPERSPEALLEPVVRVLDRRAVALRRAFFAPPDSMVGKLGKRQGPAELTWQRQLQGTWEQLCKKQAATKTPALCPESAVLPSLKVIR